MKEEYFDDEDFKELLSHYEEAISSGEPVFMDADDLADIADYYQLKGRYDDAEQAVERAAEIAPESLAVLNYRVHQALDRNDLDSAQQYLDRIMERDSPEYIYDRAEILIARGKTDEADQYLRDCLTDVPPEEYQDYVLDVANLYGDYEQSDKAMEWMMRARPEDSDDFKELMARTLFGLGKYDDSERMFNELLDRNPFEKRYWNALASTQYMKADYNESVTSSEYAIAIDPNDADAVISKANGLYRLDNFEAALEYFERYNDLRPDDEYGYLQQASCLISLERYKEAIERLELGLDIAENDSEYLVEMCQEAAFAYSELHQPERALEYLDMTESMDCDHQDMLVIRGHVMLSNGNIEEADRLYQKAMQESNYAPRIVMRIIVSLYDNKYVEQAYQMFKNFFRLVDNDWNDGYAYMALCCWDTKRYEEFLKYLKIACERNPQESRMVLAGLFPEGMASEEYYHYMQEKMKD